MELVCISKPFSPNWLQKDKQYWKCYLQLFLTPKRTQMFPFSLSATCNYSGGGHRQSSEWAHMCQNAPTPAASSGVISQDGFSGKAPNPAELQGPPGPALGRGKGFPSTASGRGSSQPRRCFQPRSTSRVSLISWSIWCRGCFLLLKQFTDTFVGNAVGFVLFIILLMKCLFVCVQGSAEETSNLSCLCWHCFICSLNTSRDCTEILRVVKCLIPYLAQQ